jgi:hypothetical protein
MQSCSTISFLTIRTEGALLPPDLLRRIQERDKSLAGITPDAYHLPAGTQLNEAISNAWNTLLGAWAAFKSGRAALPKDDPGTTLTREKWLLQLFQELNYGRLQTSKALELEGKFYPISHAWGSCPIHLVGCNVELDKRTAGVAGAARNSPHSLMQELLNRSGDHLWGFVSNGLTLRILRDSASITRQAFVEFDLEAMMDGEVYADFVLLWMLLHQSRIEGDKPEGCLLEQWSKQASEEGTRALESLRDGVEQAISDLGSGFLSHKANKELHSSLKSGQLTTQDYYRQLLRLVYRLLFIFVAEDRNLLFIPDASEEAKKRYYHYSTKLLRERAEGRRTRHSDLYEGLKLVMKILGDNGEPALGLPALGSFLFSDKATEALNTCQLSNQDLLKAVHALAFTTLQGTRRAVDYKNLGSEELGSVYESLLELHPEMSVDAGTFQLTTAAGNERKTTGSYYTPKSLINLLLDSALDPVLEDAVKGKSREEAEKAILNLKVVDPACGSGHFLIAAAQRLGKRLAAIRTGDDEPAPEATRHAVRDVIGRCIYGVDINEMAAELCKVALWMEAIEPGKALAFLDHHIKVGNSLLGTTRELILQGIPDEAFEPIEGDERAVTTFLKRRNREERQGQGRLFNIIVKNDDSIFHDFTELAALSDDSVQAQKQKARHYEELLHSDNYAYEKLIADAWCAVFAWVKTEDHVTPLTHGDFIRLIESRTCTQEQLTEIVRISKRYNFFNWHIEFPEVFLEVTKQGFDVIVGNPPWERIKIQDKEWFATHRPEISDARNASERRRLITELEQLEPSLYLKFSEAKRQSEIESQFVRSSGRFPLCGTGDINTYAIFAELNSTILSSKGRMGTVLPLGIATDNTTKDFFQMMIHDKSLVSVTGFINERFLFKGVLHNFKFCVFVASGKGEITLKPIFVFNCYSVEESNDDSKRFSLTADDIALLNPETQTCPIFFNKKSAEITLSIYRSLPLIGSEVAQISWNINTFSMFHMGNSSDNFETTPRQASLPLYESKMFHQYNHRFASFEGLPVGGRSHMLPETPLNDLKNPEYEAQPCYYIDRAKVIDALPKNYPHKWMVAFRRITSSGLFRTTTFSILPFVGAGDSVTIVYLPNLNPFQICMFVGGMNSFISDFCVRQKLAGANLSNYVFRQIPIVLPTKFVELTPLIGKIDVWIKNSILELTYAAWDLQPFAQDCGYDGPPFKWDEERRFWLRAELDALYFHLYCIERDDVNYIMETFPIVKRRDEEKYGSYRTKEAILDIYDEMARCKAEGREYQTRLDPPPASPLVAHPVSSQQDLVSRHD